MNASNYTVAQHLLTDFLPRVRVYSALGRNSTGLQHGSRYALCRIPAGIREKKISNKAILRKLLCIRPYLMEYAFTFTFESREFPLIFVSCCDSINRPGDLDLLTSK